jgi:integrase
VRYTADGQQVEESSGSHEKEVAKRLLQQRVGEIAAGKEIRPERATIDDLYALVAADYSMRKLKDQPVMEWRYEAHVKPVWGTMLVSRFTTPHVRRFVEDRRKQGASDATINRELSIVRRAFTLGYREDPPLVRRMPHIPKLQEDNVRSGFIEVGQYERLLAELPARLKALFVCAYHVGTRKGELRKIRWEQVDFEANVIRLQAAQTKAKTARTLPIYGDMEHWLRNQCQQKPAGCPWVFNHRNKPVGAQLRGWREACERAGLPNLLFHDLRRSAVRNMKRAGVQDRAAMAISGHKTRAIFDRYNIVDEGDLHNAADQMARYLEERKTTPTRLQRIR